MNGRKARGLRKQAADTAETMETSYTRMPPMQRKKCPVYLDYECQRAVYQRLKKIQ